MAVSLYLESLSPTTLLLLSTLPILILSALLHQAFFSPLAKIPGPLICRFTPLWIWYHSYCGHEARLITSLHAKYGPIVRIAPRECIISDGAALNAIYSDRGGFPKAPCYENFDFEGHTTIFSARDGEYRARRSKAVVGMFSTSNIRAGQERIEGCVRRFVERLREEAGTKEPVDLLNLCRSLALDAVSSFLFGRGYGGVEEKSGRLSASVFVDTVVASGRFFYLPHWLFGVVEAVRAKVAPSADASAEAGGAYFDGFVRELVRDTLPGEETYQGHLKKAGVGEDENAVQIMDLMFAGTDSTGTILSKLIWRLAKSPEV
jgi:cytochrome P450